MAEVRKKIVEDEYNLKKVKKDSEKTKTKKEVVSKKKEKKEKVIEKKSFLDKFRVFCHGVKSEFHKVHWPSKENMVKYSVATIFFIIFCSGFFYLIDVIFALIRSLFN